MELQEILFFLLLLTFFSSVQSKKTCPNSFCGNKSLRIRYPFMLESQQPQNCDYINVRCNNTQGIAILDLPFSGEFYIRCIDYDLSLVELYDLNNCLLGRLMNGFSLRDSPFVAKYHKNFTFYKCPQRVEGSNLTVIECLSNSTSVVVATSSVSRQEMEGSYSCSLIRTSQVPVSSYDHSDADDDTLVLKWDVPVCKDCPEDKGARRLKLITKLFAIILMMPAIAVLLFVLFVCFMCCLRMAGDRVRERTTADRSTVAQLMITAYTTAHTGLDDSKIKSCSEMVVLDINENRRTSPGICENLCCAICLEEYDAAEKVRRLSLCHHCFHADCVDQWLRNNNTCPICRVSLLDGKF